MMAATMKQAKALLRKDMKTKLSSIPDNIKALQSKIVTRKVLSHPVYQKSKRVSVYLSMKSEINTDVLVHDILATDRTCFIPMYDGNSMSIVKLKSWQDYLELPETKWKIKQPLVSDEREDALLTGGLDVILTPGVAFTTGGARCGHGKGYYDTFLQKCQDLGFKPTTIALAFNEQICDDVPVSPHDKLLDHVIYPTREEIQEELKEH